MYRIKNIYCFPSPSLQLGQVQATRRKRGLAGLALVAVESVPITTCNNNITSF